MFASYLCFEFIRQSRKPARPLAHRRRLARPTVLLTAAFLSFIFIGNNAVAYETPEYRVEETLQDDVEVRRYPSMLVAEVAVTGDRGQAVSRAFRMLAGYIFGNNAQQSKLAMTAPVMQSPASDGEPMAITAPTPDDGAWTVSFMMPSGYTVATLPAPDDPRVRLRRTEPFRAVVLRFSGMHTDRNFTRQLARLDQQVVEAALQTEGSAMLAYYDAPFKPFFLRRNEVMYRLAE